MKRETVVKIFNGFFSITFIITMFISVLYLTTNATNKRDAKRYCKYNSNSEICQKLTESCTVGQSACMEQTNDIIPIELLNDLSYTQIHKMAKSVRKYEKETSKRNKNKFHNIEIN